MNPLTVWTKVNNDSYSPGVFNDLLTDSLVNAGVALSIVYEFSYALDCLISASAPTYISGSIYTPDEMCERMCYNYDGCFKNVGENTYSNTVYMKLNFSADVCIHLTHVVTIAMDFSPPSWRRGTTLQRDECVISLNIGTDSSNDRSVLTWDPTISPVIISHLAANSLCTCGRVHISSSGDVKPNSICMKYLHAYMHFRKIFGRDVARLICCNASRFNMLLFSAEQKNSEFAKAAKYTKIFFAIRNVNRIIISITWTVKFK